MTNLILPIITILILFRTFNSIKFFFSFLMSLLVRKPVLTMPSHRPPAPIHKPETTKSQVGLDRSWVSGVPPTRADNAQEDLRE